MAICKNMKNVKKSNSPIFDLEYSPRDPVPHSGIYRCVVCGQEDAVNEHDGFPPQNRHQHPKELGEIRWKAIVLTEPKGGLRGILSRR